MSCSLTLQLQYNKLQHKHTLVLTVHILVVYPAQSQPGSEDSDSEEDIDYKPEEEWKKVSAEL